MVSSSTNPKPKECLALRTRKALIYVAWRLSLPTHMQLAHGHRQHTYMVIINVVTLLSVAVAVWNQRRFFVDNLMLGVQLADVSTS